MDTLPREILFVEIAPRAGSAGRRMLALTCREYLAELPKLCPRKIARADDLAYKLIASRVDFMDMTEVPEGVLRFSRKAVRARARSIMLFAAARRGQLPIAVVHPRDRDGLIKYIHGVRSGDVIRALMIAQRARNTNMISVIWQASGLKRVFAALAIYRGNYGLLDDMLASGGHVSTEDVAYLAHERVFEHMLVKQPELLTSGLIIEYTRSGMPLERLLRIEATGRPWPRQLVMMAAVSSQNWVVFDYTFSKTPPTKKKEEVGWIVGHGGYAHLRDHYPEVELDPKLDPANMIDDPEMYCYAESTKVAVFEDCVRILGFQETMSRIQWDLLTHVRAEWLTQAVSRLPAGDKTLPDVWIGDQKLFELFRAGASPHPESEHQKMIYAQANK